MDDLHYISVSSNRRNRFGNHDCMFGESVSDIYYYKYVTESGITVASLSQCAYCSEKSIRTSHRLGDIASEIQPTGFDIASQNCMQTRLIDGHVPRFRRSVWFSALGTQTTWCPKSGQQTHVRSPSDTFQSWESS